MSNKFNKKKFFLLLAIIISHLLPIFVSAYFNKGTQEIFHNNVLYLNEARYWVWFFTWWSAWTSLLTIFWAIQHLLIDEKKDSYRRQIWGLIIVESNLVAGLVYCLGGFLLTFPAAKNRQVAIPFPFLGKIKVISAYLVYHFFWHILAPTLVFFYFWNYCQVDRIIKNKKKSLFISLISPVIYHLFVVLRPFVFNYPRNANNKISHIYPRSYPYPFFYWSIGKVSSNWEKEMMNNLPFFWHRWPIYLQISFWLLAIFVFYYLVTFFLLKFLMKIKKSKSARIWN